MSTHIISKVNNIDIKNRIYVIQFFILLCFWFLGNVILHTKLNVFPTRYYFDVIFLVTALLLRYLNRSRPIIQSDNVINSN